LLLGAVASDAQNNPVTIGRDENVFTVLAALNNCGYDAELATSDPLRQTVRGEIGHSIENSDAAKSAAFAVCGFYRDHQQADDTKTLS
jgi:hypothetical protein